MVNQPVKKKSTIEFLLTFIVLFLLLQLGLKFLFPAQFGGTPKERPDVELSVAKVRQDHHPILTVRNNTQQDLTLPERCPQPPVDVVFTTQLPVESMMEEKELIATETALPCLYPTLVSAGESVTIDLGPWKYSLFSALGTYRVSLDPVTLNITLHDAPTTEFQITPVGSVTRLFRALVTKPLLNGLIFIASWLPDHNLGLSIIILTILIKLLLLLPNQHALEGQKKLNELQPKLEEIKKKYAKDPKKQQEETLALWKKHRINPMQSCLPMLIQFPILIGLFFTIRDGAILELSRHLLYPAYEHLTWTFGTNFFGLDLTVPNIYLMPPLLVVMQYFQMKMTFNRKKKKDVLDVGKKPFEFNQQTVMLYGLPLMIGVFAVQFPAAVSLYWGISTLFGIAQQWFVNRKNQSN